MRVDELRRLMPDSLAQYVGYWLAFLLPTLVFLLCPLVLYLGRNRYVRSPPSGSILGTVYYMFRHCMRGKWSVNPLATYRKMTTHDFWDHVTPSSLSPGARRPEWMNYEDDFVDEVIRGVQACKVFLWYPVFRMCCHLFWPCHCPDISRFRSHDESAQ